MMKNVEVKRNHIKGLVVIVNDGDCNQAYFYANKQEVLMEIPESEIIAMGEVSSTKDVCTFLFKYDFDGEYAYYFLEEDIPYCYMLDWEE